MVAGNELGWFVVVARLARLRADQDFCDLGSISLP